MADAFKWTVFVWMTIFARVPWVKSDLCGSDGTLYDIIYLMDESSDLTSSERKLQIEFFVNLTGYFMVGTDNIHIGAVKTETTATELFTLTQYNTSADVITGVNAAMLSGGYVYSWDRAYQAGLEKAYKDIIEVSKRPGATGVVIGVTGDSVADSTTAQSYVSDANAAGDKIITIAVGVAVEAAASDSDHYWRIGTGATDLVGLAPYVVNLLCTYNCSTPSTIGGITPVYTSTMYGSLADYQCTFGYVPSTFPSTSTCNVTGWTSVSSFTCELMECGRDTKYDIVFYIDESTGLTSDEAYAQLYFFMNLTHNIYVGTNYANIAAVKVKGSPGTATEVFNLTTYTSTGSVGSALVHQTMSRSYSYQYFEDGLPYVYDTLLMGNKRSDSTGVIISVTGDSRAASSNTATYVSKANTDGNMMITIGLDVMVNPTATDTSHYFYAPSSSDLNGLIPYVKNLLCPYNCSTPSDIGGISPVYASTLYGTVADYQCSFGYVPSAFPTTSTCNVTGWSSLSPFTCDLRECGRDTKYDIVFYMDESNGLTSAEAYAQLYFFMNLTQNIYVGTNYANIAAVKVKGSPGTATEVFNLTTYTSTGSVGSALVYHTFSRSYSYQYFEDGLPYVYDTLLMGNKRSDSTGVIISVTGDSRAASSNTATYVSKANTDGNMMITIGLDVMVNPAATDTSHYFYAPSSSDLNNLIPYVKNLLCPYNCSTPPDVATLPIPTPTYTSTLYGSVAYYGCNFGQNPSALPVSISCNVTGWSSLSATPFTCDDIECGRTGTLFDVVFVLDESSSLSSAEFYSQVYFFQNLTYQMYVDTNYVNIAAVKTQSSGATLLFNLTTYTTSGQVMTALTSVTRSAGSRDFEPGLLMAYNTILSANKRAGAIAVVIAVTADNGADTNPVKAVAASASTAGDMVIVLGADVDVGDASTNPAKHFFRVTGSAFNTYLTNVVNLLCPVDCGTPPVYEHATSNFTTTTYDSLVDYECDTGYTASTTARITCPGTGIWPNDTFTCDIHDCGAPTSISNGDVDYNATTYGQEATYSCTTGYHLSSTPATVKCNTTGWTILSVTCELDDCGAPPTLANAVESYTTTTYLSTTSYTCDAGYDPSQGSMQITCQPAGWDSVASFKCNPKDCGTPTATIALATSTYTNTTLNSVVQFTCIQGYAIDPSSNPGTITCELSGSTVSWSTASFTCVKNDCKNVSKSFKDPSTLTANNDNLLGKMYILYDTALQVDCCGVISGWEFQPLVEGFINMVVWRKNAQNTFYVVGKNLILITNTSILMNYTALSNERIAVIAGDVVGWHTTGPSMIPYADCTTGADPNCPQQTMYTDGPTELADNHVFDWANSGTVVANRAYAIKYYFTQNIALNFNQTLYNETIPDHWSVDQAVTTVVPTGDDYAENVTYTMTAIPAGSNDYFYIDQSGVVRVHKTLARAKVAHEFTYNVSAIDQCGNQAWTEVVINTYNAPPTYMNLPGKLDVEEDTEGYVQLFHINVSDPTDDPVCCTIEGVHPQSLNFELELVEIPSSNNSNLYIRTTKNAYFIYADFNSYLIKVCCQDEDFGSFGVLQVNVKPPEKNTVVVAPGWLYVSVVISCVPLLIMFLLGCGLVFHTTFMS